MSGGFRVSDSTIETAARAGYEYDGDFGAPWPDAGEGMRDGYRDGMRAALAAALPSLVAEIEQSLRERIAAEIEREQALDREALEPESSTVRASRDGANYAYANAIRVARGDAG